ncbi:MAG: DNA-binding protein Alba [Candidatus Aenigmatarchaeota archaeon]
MAEGESDDNTVYVGKKPAMSYVLACVTQFNEGNDEVNIKARGKSISRAVDVAEITRNRFVEEAKVDNIDISTEEIDTEEGDEINVSSITITLKK